LYYYFTGTGLLLFRNFQYIANSLLQIRGEDPLESFVPASSELCIKGNDIPDYFEYEPRVFQVKNTMRFASYIPGMLGFLKFTTHYFNTSEIFLYLKDIGLETSKKHL